jgi:hypothetical protein
MLTGYTAFWLMIVVQAIVYIAFCVKFKVSIRRATHIALWSLVLAIPTGLFHDLFYFRFLQNGGYHLGFGLGFMLLNSLFSYGFFFASIAVLPIRLRRQPVSALYCGVLFFSIILLIALTVLYPHSIFSVLIGGGLVFVVTGELALVLSGFGHLFTRFISLMQNWLYVIVLGAVYEIADVYTPVWFWNQYDMPWFIFSPLLIMFGYAAFAYSNFGIYKFAQRYIRTLL